MWSVKDWSIIFCFRWEIKCNGSRDYLVKYEVLLKDLHMAPLILFSDENEKIVHE